MLKGEMTERKPALSEGWGLSESAVRRAGCMQRHHVGHVLRACSHPQNRGPAD